MTEEQQGKTGRYYITIGLTALIFLTLGFGGWASLTTISGAVIAAGRVEVDQNRQVVQHLDGGIVAEILVNEGEEVNAGEVLIKLDDQLMLAEAKILEDQLFELAAERARLKSERDDLDTIQFDLNFQNYISANAEASSLAAGQSRLFAIRRVALEQQLDQLKKRQDQIEDLILGVESQSSSLTMQIELLAKELRAQEDLLKKGLAQSARVLGLQREEAKLLGLQGELIAEKAQAEGQITDISLEISRLKTQRRENAISTLREIEVRELELSQKLSVQKERLSRLEIKAPVDGIVYGMTIFAKNSVVRPAEPLLFIIPRGRHLVTAVEIDPNHIDQVYIGQPAFLRLSSFDQSQTPELLGTVRQVSADIFVDDVTQRAFYKVQIHLNSNELEKLPSNLTLLPGMPVESFITTSERSPFEYLVSPFTNYFKRALRED